MTNWVTIKIPEGTREQAKDDPRTYEEIMQAGLDKPTAEDISIPSSVQESGEEPNVDEIAEAVVDLFTAEVYEPAGKSDVDESEIAKQVVNDLQSTLPRKIAEEMR